MKGVSFHPEARAEFAAAVRWYENERSGLGHDFRQEAKAAIEATAQAPEAYGILRDDIRCHMLQRFPYGILYQVHAGQILVVAVMHLHRAPEYWQDRV